MCRLMLPSARLQCAMPNNTPPHHCIHLSSPALYAAAHRAGPVLQRSHPTTSPGLPGYIPEPATGPKHALAERAGIHRTLGEWMIDGRASRENYTSGHQNPLFASRSWNSSTLPVATLSVAGLPVHLV